MNGDSWRISHHKTPVSEISGLSSIGARGETKTATATSPRANERSCIGEYGDQLTMAIIGCLPDNVQQAIKSFSIRKGNQHVTFAFPFMEDLIRRFSGRRPLCRSHEDLSYRISDDERCQYNPRTQELRALTPAMFFDVCPEIIQGFETLVTLVPDANRRNHTIALLTLNQKGSLEGYKKHMESLFSILVMEKNVNELKDLPLLAIDVNSKLLLEMIDAGANSVVEVHGDNLVAAHPGKSNSHILHMIKEEFISAMIVSYRELLHLNTQEIKLLLDQAKSSKLERREVMDPGHFHSIMDLLQSPSCLPQDFHQIHFLLMDPSMDKSVQEFWRFWSHEQLSEKVFPVLQRREGRGAQQYQMGNKDLELNQPAHVIQISDSVSYNFSNCQQPYFMGNILTRVPVKEGLATIIKCLKNQDNSIFPPRGSPPCKRSAVTVESAFHPPLKLFTNHHLAKSQQDINARKKRIFEPPSHDAHATKSMQDKEYSKSGLKRTLRPTFRLIDLPSKDVRLCIPSVNNGSVRVRASVRRQPIPEFSCYGTSCFCCPRLPFSWRNNQN